jgi:signal transduction histidine kinase
MAKLPDTLTSGGTFLKKNWQVIYAVILILLVPTTIVLNTMFVVNRFSRTVDVELQRTALIIGKMFNVTSTDLFGDPMALQQRIIDIAKVIPEVKSLDILAKNGEDFIVIASLQPEGVGASAHGRQNILSWYDDQAIAYLTRSPRSAALDQQITVEEARSDARYWGIVMPLDDANGQKTYLLSAKISLDVIDALVRSNLFWSYTWLAVTVLIIIMVLASNTRLFQYALLFRRLKEVDQMKDDFIGMASHELRAPITAVRGYLSLFLEDAFGKLEEKPKQVIKTTFAISTHLATLVEDLLDVSRIEQGRMSFDWIDTSVDGIIDEVVSQLHFEAEKKNLTFSFEPFQRPSPKVRIDISRFKQVLINFCSNGIKYTPSGSVTVTTEVKDGKWLEIRVTDTGLGMSAEQREKLFTKFYRIKTDETRDIPGTGLGLWVTKKIVELMKGRIYVDSIEKVGTQMSVLLPIIGGADDEVAVSTSRDGSGIKNAVPAPEADTEEPPAKQP